ncbi:MAG: non-homologous end-joining DNA ligase [Verrucomicrobiota bacterium]|nr:non-homologous end-joining DNA ligase [Verrucomicrobiota bacterium]
MGIESRGEEKKAVKRKSLSLPRDLPAGKPRFISPMKAKLAEAAPTGGDWSYELKFDGIRLIAVKDGTKVNLISRNKNELGARFSEVAEAIASLPGKNCVIDGEVVAVDERGRSSFQLLQGRELPGGKNYPVYFYAFDLLQAEDRLLLNQPLEKRKAWLQQLCAGARDPIRYSGEIEGDVAKLLEQVQRLGLEGLIGKLCGSVYESDRRSGAWIKLKVLNEQEFVIGGYTPPAGARKYFGALLVGYYERNRLLFAGKVGTGFDAKSLASLHAKLRKEARNHCPFADLPSKQNGQWVQGITPSMMRKMYWVNPVFVCQIKFAEWTRDAKLRQPVFLGLREDKTPKEVKREMPQ